MTAIDSTARIAAGAQLGKDVTIGPYCVIGPKVTIEDGCQLLTHVHVTGRTTIGPRTRISAFASLGTPPQSFHYKGEDTTLTIGPDCDIREHVTINIGTAESGGTKVGERCMLMVGAHIGHDCVVGNNVVFANNASLGGFAQIADHVFLGGLCAVHQFARVGEQAIIGGLAGVTNDVIPYAAVIGNRGKLAGLNRIGLKRRGFSPEDLRKIYGAYRAIFYGPGTLTERVDAPAEEYAGDVHVMRIIDFIRSGKRRLAVPRVGHDDDE